MISRIIPLALCLLAACAPERAVGGGDSGGAVVPDQVLRLFERRGVCFDEAEVRRAAAAAMLAAVDPRARLLDAEAARAWATNRSIACVTQEAARVGYVKLNGCFDADAAAIAPAIRGATPTNAAGLIVDLRGAGGGSVAAMAGLIGAVAGPGDDLVGVRSASGETVDMLQAGGAGEEGARAPLVLLVDGGTWGAAEAVVLALQGRRGVCVLGRPTAGDGTAREIEDLGGGVYALAPTGRYVRGDGTEVAAGGLIPDLCVPVAAGAPPEGAAAGGRGDAVRQRAVDLLLGLAAMSATWITDD